MLTVSSQVQQIINYLGRDFPYNCNVSTLCRSMLRHILDNGASYGSAGRRGMRVAARPFSLFLKCHMKIILN